MTTILNRIHRKLAKRSVFDIPLQKQTAYLYKLGNPKDDIERSYFQYKCQKSLMKKGIALGYEIGSFFLYGLYRYILINRRDNLTDYATDALFLYGGANDIIPDSLRTSYCIRQIENFQTKMLITKNGSCFIKTINNRYPFSWYFKLKCLFKIAMYDYCIQMYQPEAIIVSEEYSFTSSVLTDYCNRFAIEHINIMHGEKLFNIGDSFFRFNRCYIWDKHYKELFIDLHAEANQFIIEKPISQLKWEIHSIKKNIDYTYYLGGENKQKLVKISNILQKLMCKGFVVAVRPHPLVSKPKEIKKLFKEFIIEDPKIISIKESILRTKNVVSLYSTVLGQAANNNVNVVIDDISAPLEYIKLKELRFIIISNRHKKLSDELKNYR